MGEWSMATRRSWVVEERVGRGMVKERKREGIIVSNVAMSSSMDMEIELSIFSMFWLETEICNLPPSTMYSTF